MSDPELLERAIGAVDTAAVSGRGKDPWLYFYEQFSGRIRPGDA